MKSIKPILWSRPTSDGEYQIKIRITENRKPIYINVGIKIKKGDNKWSYLYVSIFYILKSIYFISTFNN